MPITNRDELIEHLKAKHPESEFILAGADAFTQTIPATLHKVRGRRQKAFRNPLTFNWQSLGELGWQCTNVSPKEKECRK